MKKEAFTTTTGNKDLLDEAAKQRGEKAAALRFIVWFWQVAQVSMT